MAPNVKRVEVIPNFLGALWAKLAGSDQAPKDGQQLYVDQLRRMQVLRLRQALVERPITRLTGEC
jgi:hypothetical protein